MTSNLGPAILIGVIGCGIIYAVFKRLSGGKMGKKEDSVAAFVSAVQAAEVQALNDEGGKLYDGAFADGAGSAGSDPDEQAKIDAAVAAAIAPKDAMIADLQGQLKDVGDQDVADKADAQAAKDLLAAAQGQILDLGKQLAVSGDKLTADEGVINGFKGSIEQLKGLVAQLEAIILPPAPAPAP